MVILEGIFGGEKNTFLTAKYESVVFRRGGGPREALYKLVVFQEVKRLDTINQGWKLSRKISGVPVK